MKSDAVLEVRTQARRVLASTAALRANPSSTLDAIVRATERLADANDVLGANVRHALLTHTGLSAPMIDWCLRTSLEPATHDALLELRAGALEHAGRPVRLAVAILAGNVFTASYRALIFPLLVGVPVLAKAASADDSFARALEHAIQVCDPQIGDALAVLTFPGDDTAARQTLLEQAECVSVYGADDTIDAVRAQVSTGTRVVAHGHGLGLLVVPRGACKSTDDAEAFVARAALDVGAYDQRGCLSPHALLVEGGGSVDARGLAERLASRGLSEMEHTLPRGPLPEHAAAAQAQWRGVAAVRGDLFETRTFAVSYEASASLRTSPGYRNIGVYSYDDAADLAARLAPLGEHLKCVGVGGAEVHLEHVREVLGAVPAIAPRICAAGTMQTPPLDALADGRPAFDGFLRDQSG